VGSDNLAKNNLIVTERFETGMNVSVDGQKKESRAAIMYLLSMITTAPVLVPGSLFERPDPPAARPIQRILAGR